MWLLQGKDLEMVQIYIWILDCVYSINLLLILIGLSDCLTDKEQSFDVDLSLAGYGRLSIYVDGPVDTDVDVTDTTDGFCRVTYVPTVKGLYDVNILVDDEHISGEY